MQNIKELPLYDDLQYRYSIDLEGKTFTLDFKWKNRTNSWYFSIQDQDLTKVISEYKIVAYFPMLVDYPLEEMGLTGYFLLLDKGEYPAQSLHKAPSELKNKYRLFYIYNKD